MWSQNNECSCLGKTCINHRLWEAKHKIKANALVRAIWAQLGDSVWVTVTQFHSKICRINSIICIFWDHPCLSGIIIIFFASLPFYLLNTQSQWSLVLALPSLFSDFSLPQLCNLPLIPHYFSKRIVLNYGYASCNYWSNAHRKGSPKRLNCCYCCYYYHH